GIAEIQKLVLEGVDRTRERLRGVFDPFGILAAELLLQIDQEHEEDMNSIRQDIEEAGTLRVRLRWFRADFVQRLHRLLEKSSAVVMKVLRAAFLVGKERYYEAETLALKIAPSLGLSVPTRESLQRLTDLPTYEEVYGKSKKIPPVYRRLFTPQPLLTKEFLVAREEALDSLFESVKRWQAGRPCSVAIVGPQGSGKTSLLNCFTNEVRSKVFLEKKEVKDRLGGKEEVFRLFENWFSLSKTCDSVSDVVSQLLEQKKRIVLVEGGHNLILRTIGGGTTAETFFSIVLGTRDHLLWILSVRQYPWQRMEYQLRASQYFTHEIRTLFHDEQELSEALMLRQRVSGFRLIYSDEGLDTRRINKLRLRNPLEAEVVQRELEKEYFKSLFELSGGNLESALFFWLLSSSYEESENVVRVAPCVTLDYRFLRRFDNQILFSLAELTNHGGLTLAEHSEIFRLDPSKSRLILDYLVEIRLVDCKSQGDERMPVYVVNPIVLHPVATLLESLNILY
ncbi:MAG: AAA family ATPase, partial [bacterium]